MARVVITIEDIDGKVKVVAEPNFETMLKMEVSGAGMTSAHGYAITALNAIRRESKKLEPTMIKIPRLLRP